MSDRLTPTMTADGAALLANARQLAGRPATA
jgi:hypothetical protein